MGTGKIRTHTYTDPGYYEMTLTVYDDQNASDSITRPFTVLNPPPAPSQLEVKKAAESYFGTDTMLWVYHYSSLFYYGNVVLMARETTKKGTFDIWFTVRHMYHGDAAGGWSYYASEYPALSGAYSNKFFVFITEPTRFTPFVSLSAHPDPLSWNELTPGMVLYRVGYQYSEKQFWRNVDFGEIIFLKDPAGPWSIAYNGFNEPGFSGSLILYYKDENQDGIATPEEFWYVGLCQGQNAGTDIAWATYGHPEINNSVTVPLQSAPHLGWNVVSLSNKLNKEETWKIIEKALWDFDNALIQHQ